VAVTEKFTITYILNVVTQLQLEFFKSISIYLNIPQKKSSELPSEPHKIHCNMKFVKSQKLNNFPKHQICSRNNQGHAVRSGENLLRATNMHTKFCTPGLVTRF